MRILKWLLIITLAASLVYVYFFKGKPDDQVKAVIEQQKEHISKIFKSEHKALDKPKKTKTHTIEEDSKLVIKLPTKKKSPAIFHRHHNLESHFPTSYQGRTTIDEVPAISDIMDTAEPVLALQSGFFKLDPQYTPKVGSSGEHLYLQLNKAVDESDIQRLRTIGLEIYQYIHPNTWVVKLSENSQVSRLKQLPFVYAIGSIDPRDKIEQNLLKTGVSPEHSHSDGRLSILIKLRSSNDKAKVSEQIMELGGEIENSQGFDYQGPETLVVKINQLAIVKLASKDNIAWIQEKPQPVLALTQRAAEFSGVTKANHQYGLQGQGVTIGIWDGGVAPPHKNWGRQVEIIDEPWYHGMTYTTVSLSHAFHVTGIIADQESGIAKQADVKLYEFYGDTYQEMRDAKKQYDIDIINQSFGVNYGCREGINNLNTRQLFGHYLDATQKTDSVIYDTGVLATKAAGNDRNESCTVGAEEKTDGEEHGGYYTLASRSNALNVVTVGSVGHGFDERTGIGASTSSFSSWGPTIDGRIKPDLVAWGFQVRSTDLDNGYKYDSGTSMATPVVAGIAALLYQRARTVLSMPVEGSLIKAILIHTAKDWAFPGPDFKTGWGLADAEAGVKHIDKGQAFSHEVKLTKPQQLYSLHLVVDEQQEVLKTTTVWNDVPAVLGAKFALTHDFNTQLISPSGHVYLPWVKDSQNLNKPAEPGMNHVDNVEQILVENPEPGTWQWVIEAPQNLLKAHKLHMVSTAAKEMVSSPLAVELEP